MNIGNTIRTRRRAKEMTQEELAELLDVSISAVSLWESGKTMPDIGLIPAICGVLEVSADELLGIDLLNKDEEINAILEEAGKSGTRGYLEDALAVIEAGLRRFPDNPELWSEAMHYHYNLYTMDDTRTDDRDKAIGYGERILETCTDSMTRELALQILCFLCRDDNPERAKELLLEAGSIYISKEVLAVNTLKGDLQLEAIHSLTTITLDLLTAKMTYNSVLDSGGTRFDRDEMAEMQKKLIAIYDAVFEEGDYGFYHTRLYDAHRRLAGYYADKQDAGNALEQLGLAAYHAVEFVKFEKYGNGEYVNTSLALRGRKSGGFSTTTPSNDAKALLDAMQDARYDFVRDSAKFAYVTATLTRYAGNWEKK